MFITGIFIIGIFTQNITIVEPENHPSGRYETDAYKTLRIRFPLPSDSGKYICVATNAGGVTEASAILQVLSEWTI